LASVRRAGELTAISEHARAKYMGSDGGDAHLINAIVRTDNSARRAIKDLDIKPPESKPFNIAEALAARGIQPPVPTKKPEDT
jgi:hypothetical protein